MKKKNVRLILIIFDIRLFKWLYSIIEESSWNCLLIHLKIQQWKLTLHIHNHRDIQGTVTIRCLAVVSAIATSGYRHFQVEHVSLRNSVGGRTFTEPPEVRFWSCFRVALDDFRDRVHCHIDHLLRDCDIFRRDFIGKEKKKIGFLIIFGNKPLFNSNIFPFLNL